MTPEGESASNEAESVDSSSSPDLPSMWAPVCAPGEYKATNERNRPSQPTVGIISSGNERVSVALIDEHSFTQQSITRSLRELCSLLDIASFATSQECLESTRNYDLILYHTHENVANQNNNSQSLASINKVLPIGPVIMLCDVDSSDAIRAAFNIGVRGYIPTGSTTLELAIEIMYLVKLGGTFVPPSSLSRPTIKPEGTRNLNTIQPFTPRQLSVLRCLKSGKTNKIIAYELGISVSSVKAHIRNIMNKMNATNRTEVACRAQHFEMRGTWLADDDEGEF